MSAEPTRDLLDSDDDVDLMETHSNPTSEERAKETIRSYQRMAKVGQTADPLMFWQKVQPQMPELTMLSMRYTVVQATSVASERIFSIAGDIVRAERSRLEPEQVDALIFLKKNMHDV